MSARNPDEFGKQLLLQQYKQLTKEGYSIGLVNDNIYEWRVILPGPPDTLYDGGYFPCTLKFPSSFPTSPPEMRFLTPNFWHPNVYEDGRVCISILHEPKEDEFNQQELLSEKWRPILGVEAILVSVQSMLSEPNFDSPANVDASIQWRNKPDEYKRRIRLLVRRSIEDL